LREEDPAAEELAKSRPLIETAVSTIKFFFFQQKTVTEIRISRL
jgi:hypothetical protein